MMERHALQLDVAAVEPEAGRGLEPRVPHAKAHLPIIQHRAVVREQADRRAVQGGIVQVPAAQLRQRHVQRHGAGAAGIDQGDRCAAVRDLPSLRIGQHQIDRHLRRRRGGVADVGGDGDGRAVAVDRAGMDEGAALRDVDVAGFDQADMPVDARAAIPARGRSGGGVGAHGDDVAPVRAQMAGDVVAQADIAHRAIADMMAVHPDAAAFHDAVKFEEIAPPRRRRERQGAPIPGDAAGQEAIFTRRLRILVEGAGDRPVMGHRHRPPAAIVQRGAFRALRVALIEAPAIGQGRDCARRRLRLVREGGAGSQRAGEKQEEGQAKAPPEWRRARNDGAAFWHDPTPPYA